MRYPEKNYYVTVTLPRDHPAVQQMVTEADETGCTLASIVRATCLKAYSDLEIPLPKKQLETKKKRASLSTTEEEIEVSEDILDGADDFLDNL